MSLTLPQSWQTFAGDLCATPAWQALSDAVEREYATTTIYPPRNQVFAALEACPPESIRVVILGQDPYHGPGQANGLAFSVSDGIECPPSLRNILQEVHNETGAPIPPNGDLTRWARQGVLLLNSSLTVRAGQAGSHRALGWEAWTDALIARISDRSNSLIFLLWGSWAARKAPLINARRHLIYKSAHPSPLSVYRGFWGCNHFKDVNERLTRLGQTPIVW